MITISYWALAATCLGLGAAAYGLGRWSAELRADRLVMLTQGMNDETKTDRIIQPEEDGEHIAEFERVVLAWAAEHPDKPVPERCSCYSGAHEQGWPNQQVQTLYGGGELSLDAPPGRYPLVCKCDRYGGDGDD